jgi:AcrR family transcriptional regulator
VSARGQDTRAALIRAALEVFGRDGFHAASTRAIADAAGANQALIGYHFGSKEGLYLASFEHIAARMREHLGPVLDRIERGLDGAEPRSGSARARLARHLPALNRLLDALTAVLVGEEAAGWARLVLREQQSPTRAFDTFYGGAIGRLVDLVARLTGRITQTQPDALATHLLVFTIIGQLLVFRVANAAVMRRTRWTRIGPTELAAIQQRVRRNVAAILRAETAS